MRNPWGKPCQVQQADGPSQHLVDEILHFETEPGMRYLVLPEEAPIPALRRITAEPATGPVSYRFTFPGGTTAGGTLGRP